MNVSDVCEAMNRIAPTQMAQDWDNVGLLIGDPDTPVERVLLCIDLAEPVLDEAARHHCGMVVAYHPPLFKAIQKLTPATAPIVWRAARMGMAVYSPHTALDVAPGGTNDVLADMLGLVDCEPLEPVTGTQGTKIVVFTPRDDLDAVSSAAFEAGAGRIGLYECCSFYSEGTGTFRGLPGSDPTVGSAGRFEHAPELRLELVCPTDRVLQVTDAIRHAHSYEEPAIDVIPTLADVAGGLGRVGPVADPASLKEMIERIRAGLRVDHVQMATPSKTDLLKRLIRRAACCAGSCGATFRAAAAKGADLFLTGEMRHHDALEAVRLGMSVVTVGHSNSERVALESLRASLLDRLDGLDVVVSTADADPFRTV